MNVKASILPYQKHLFSLDEDTHYFNCAYMRKRDPSHLNPSDSFRESDFEALFEVLKQAANHPR